MPDHSKGCYSPILGKRTSALHIILAYVGVCQRAFKNRYIFRQDYAREERKVWRYSVLSSLTVERECEEF